MMMKSWGIEIACMSVLVLMFVFAMATALII